MILTHGRVAAAHYNKEEQAVGCTKYPIHKQDRKFSAREMHFSTRGSNFIPAIILQFLPKLFLLRFHQLRGYVGKETAFWGWFLRLWGSFLPPWISYSSKLSAFFHSSLLWIFLSAVFAVFLGMQGNCSIWISKNECPEPVNLVPVPHILSPLVS